MYQTPQKSPLPEVKDKDWAWSPVDHFVRARQEAAEVRPVKDAEPTVWLRRVSFDLVGLPPSAEQLAAIERDSSRQAREKLVDQLLSSPQYGERWGRHWMDVARFAETTGKERNIPYPQAMALPRLGHRRLQRRQAVRPLYPGADRRRLAALRFRGAARRPDDRHRFPGAGAEGDQRTQPGIVLVGHRR